MRPFAPDNAPRARPARAVSRLTGLLALALLTTLLPLPATAQHFDLLIRGGQVLDGSGSPAYTADIAITDDVIITIGKLPTATADRIIDATGKYIVPGFIDMHSHADRAFASDNIEGRRAHNLVMQGITTSVFGPDGRNPVWPVEAEMDAYRTPGVATNVVPMVGHGTVRGRVMGNDYERAATEPEIAEMAELVRTGMEEGAWGLGAGPEYRPGRFSTTEELIALADVVADYDGFYYAHQRSQSPLPLWQIPSIVDGQPLTGTDGMRETIEIGRAAGIRVVGTHIKAKGTDTWGHSQTDILMIEAARREGVDVYLEPVPVRDLRRRSRRRDPRLGLRAPRHGSQRWPRRADLAERRADERPEGEPAGEPGRPGGGRRAGARYAIHPAAAGRSGPSHRRRRA